MPDETRTEESGQERAAESHGLRVLVIAPSLEMLGGQSRQCARLLGQLKKEPSLKVSFLAVNPRLPGFLHTLQKIKYVRTIVTTLAYWALLLVRVWRYDILHIFSASYYSYMLCAMPPLLLGKLLGKKTILNYRSGEAEDHLSNWRTAIPTMRLADAIIVPSGYLVDVLAKFGLRAESIFNIIELDRFRFRERAPLSPVFLTSRLLEPLYNVGCVLRAFKIIQEQRPEARLTVAGEGWQRAEMEELAHTLCLRETKFIGRVAFEEMPAMYDGADVYLTATDLDNMPSSITECLAAGLPVVTTNAGGIPYIVRHEETCMLIERNDHEAMAAAALRLLDDPLLAAKIARQGREHSRQWTWERVGSSWLALYHELGADTKAVSSRRKLA
ncbi:MAG: glycosyltransferase family 4 protein [Pyrinomonadaceae bacterium]|nr:glycosyltransferase family 4 protein [Pyrinomonadaceae bacterium]